MAPRCYRQERPQPRSEFSGQRRKGELPVSLDLVAIRRDLHRHPELAFAEHRTAAVVEDHLRKLGLSPQRLAGTGVIADIAGRGAGPTVALRADMDALPIEEASGVPFASEAPGKMHACGHDAHTTMLLGAAERLVARRQGLNGTVRLLFQPAEEVGLGAKAMIEAGALEGVSSVYGLHNAPWLPVGTAAVRPGPLLAGAARFDIAVSGVGGHAAMPHTTADPVVAGAAIVSALQTIVSRNVDPLQSAVITIGRFHAGHAHNVIPDRAELTGTLRYFAPELAERLPALIRQRAEQLAAAYGCTATVAVTDRIPVVWNEERTAAVAEVALTGVLGKERVLPMDPVMGSEDFAAYQEHVPGTFFWVGSGGPYGLHHPSFTLDEGCLPVGADLLAAVAEAALAAGA